MLEKIRKAINELDKLSESKPILVISHFDTDGITSASIFSRALSRWGKKFSLRITKGLEESYIRELPNDHILIFLDLASGSLNYLKDKKTEVFVFDHHEIPSKSQILDTRVSSNHEIIDEIPENVRMINPVLENHEPISAAAVCYLFAKSLSPQNKDLAKLAVIGMVGDLHEKVIGKTFSEILEDSETVVKKGLMLYPSTRPLDKALEYSSNPYIPGVSGSRTGVIELLRDSGLQVENGRYKALYELDEEEMKKLITSIALKTKTSSNFDNMIGNLFLVKFFNKLEDARELSALINACSRMGSPEVALGLCLGNRALKIEAESVYIEYKQNLVSALKYVSETSKEAGKNYLIINGRDRIKDTIIGTVASIVSHSPLYDEGLVVIALAYNQDKIKVSARLSGRTGRNVRDVLHKAVVSLGGEVGGHPNAAGCLIPKEKEEEFITEVKKILDIEVLKV